ncbi:MAG: DUF554 domain-containing protein [Clostridia bacterium]|nr:DUF554 domain-containing protein [Clostridia bacterium]
MIGLLGTFVNMILVILGGTIGLFLGSRFPKKLSDSLMKALGLCTLLIGISGLSEGENQLITIISMAIGTVIGELLDLDGKLNLLGESIENRFKKDGDNVTIAEGFVNASLLFCVGAMAIVGSLQSGLVGDNSMIYTKSLLDFTAAIIFASTLGVGVLLSAFPILIYQGGIVVLAHFLAPFLTDSVIGDMTCTGSLIIIGLALNMLGITKLKVMNMVPAIFLPILMHLFV